MPRPDGHLTPASGWSLCSMGQQATHNRLVRVRVPAVPPPFRACSTHVLPGVARRIAGLVMCAASPQVVRGRRHRRAALESQHLADEHGLIRAPWLGIHVSRKQASAYGHPMRRQPDVPPSRSSSCLVVCHHHVLMGLLIPHPHASGPRSAAGSGQCEARRRDNRLLAVSRRQRCLPRPGIPVAGSSMGRDGESNAEACCRCWRPSAPDHILAIPEACANACGSVVRYRPRGCTSSIPGGTLPAIAGATRPTWCRRTSQHQLVHGPIGLPDRDPVRDGATSLFGQRP